VPYARFVQLYVVLLLHFGVMYVKQNERSCIKPWGNHEDETKRYLIRTINREWREVETFDASQEESKQKISKLGACTRKEVNK
jgi:hypothetical protein